METVNITKNAPTMDAKTKMLWLNALRSGVYAQGKSSLKSYDGKQYCCLGVLCDVIQGWDSNRGFVGVLSPENEDRAGFKNFDTFTLAKMNDTGKSFAEISDYIEATL